MQRMSRDCVIHVKCCAFHFNMLFPGKVFKVGFAAFPDALPGQVRRSVKLCCQMGIFAIQLWRDFPVVGNNKVVVAHTIVNFVIQQHMQEGK